jgi:hypothetical protein
LIAGIALIALGWTAGSERSQQEAAALAERMWPVMAELAHLSAHQAWYAATAIRLRERLALDRCRMSCLPLRLAHGGAPGRRKS